jgi:hypothetical protein
MCFQCHNIASSSFATVLQPSSTVCYQGQIMPISCSYNDERYVNDNIKILSGNVHARNKVTRDIRNDLKYNANPILSMWVNRRMVRRHLPVKR